MKILIVILTLLALGKMLTTPARAQDADKYDPILAKRADRRIKNTRAQREAAQARENEAAKADAPQAPQAPRVDHSKMVDFMAHSAKRADLRIRTLQVGSEQSYAEWLKREGGH